MNAQQRNLPRGWVLKDDRLLAIARAAPNSTAQLHAIDGLAPGLLRRHGSELLQAIQAPATQLTGANDMHLPRLTGAGKLLLQNLLVALRHCSETNLVSSSLIATRRELESAICGRTEIRLYEGWRNNLFGYSVREAIAAHAASKLYE
jgi:ribonuclease D